MYESRIHPPYAQSTLAQHGVLHNGGTKMQTGWFHITVEQKEQYPAAVNDVKLLALLVVLLNVFRPKPYKLMPILSDSKKYKLNNEATFHPLIIYNKMN